MKKRPVIWLIKRVRRRIPAVALMSVIYMAQALLKVAFALGSSRVVDAAVSGAHPRFVEACLIQGGIVVGILVCLTLSRHMTERLSAELERDWKKDLLHGLLYGEYAAVSGYHSAELLNRLNNDVRKVNDGILHVLPNSCAMVVQLISAFAVLVALDWRLTLLAMLAGLAVILGTGLARRRLKDLNKQVSEHDGKVSGFLQESIEKLLMIQSMGVESEMESRAQILMDERYKVQRVRKNVSLMANTGVSLMSYGAGFFALLWCSFRLLTGEMTFGTLTAVTQLVSQLRAPVVGMSGIMPHFLAMTASAERLMELDEIRGIPETEMPDVDRIYKDAKTICAESLSFGYDRDQILKDANFTVPKGTFTAITGASGIGKSTLLKLLLGVFPCGDGSLCLRGESGDLPLDRRTRKLFAYVPQGNLLLSGTLRENILVTKPDASEAEMERAIYVSAMDDFLHQLPKGLDTLIGESGMGLSEGQAQRLAIARAVLSDAPILLLDECTSALDSETERKVLERICQLPERTCIAVTHRPAALSLCHYQMELNRNGSVTVQAMKAQK